MSTNGNERIDVLAVMRHTVSALHGAADDGEIDRRYADDLHEAHAVVAELIEALKAFDLWNYEVQSAKVNGESVYSYADLQEMRERAASLAHTVLARIRSQA